MRKTLTTLKSTIYSGWHAVIPPKRSLFSSPSESRRERCKYTRCKRGRVHGSRRKGRSPKAPARLLRVPGRDGGGKSRPDYGLPNLTSWPLRVVNIRCSVFKARFDAGRSVL